jgi:hypothetical protein
MINWQTTHFAMLLESSEESSQLLKSDEGMQVWEGVA